MVLIATGIANSSESVYLVELSDSQPMYPIILDLENEKSINLKLMLPDKFNYHIFLDSKANRILLVQEDAMNESVNIYVSDLKAEKLEDPVFSTSDEDAFWLSRCAWSSSASTLSFTGRYIGRDANKKKLVLTMLKIDDKGTTAKEVNLSKYVFSHTGLWGLPDHVLIIGRSSKYIDEKGGAPDKSILVDLQNYKIKEIPFAQKKYTILGYFRPNQLAVSDFKTIYSFNLKSLQKVCDYPEGLNLVFGIDGKKSGYFALLTKVEKDKGNFFEKEILSFISFRNFRNQKVMYNGKRIETGTSSFGRLHGIQGKIGVTH